MSKATFKHTPVRNRAPLTTRFCSLRCVYRQPSTTLQNSTPKRARQRPESSSQEAMYHGILARTSSRYQVLRKTALETERRCFSKVILESNVTLNITRSSNSLSTVPPIVNGGDWRCIVRDLKTIIVTDLLAFNFIPQRSHHSITNRGKYIKVRTKFSEMTLFAIIVTSVKFKPK